MDFSSWIRKALLKKNQPETSAHTHYESKQQKKQKEEEEEELGVTEQLQDFVKSFTLETFKNFPLQDDQETKVITTDGSSMASENVQKDLSEWQERHAMLVLSKVNEVSQLRYVLCPRHLKERQFWKIYFMLVKTFVAPYEIDAIRKAKLKRMEKKEEKLLDSACEVEMAEAKGTTSVSLPLEHELSSLMGDGGNRNVAEGEVRIDGEDLVKAI